MQVCNALLKLYALSFYFESSPVHFLHLLEVVFIIRIAFTLFLGTQNSTLIPILVLNHCMEQATNFLHFHCLRIEISVRIKASSKPEGRQMECVANQTPWRWRNISSCRGTRLQCHGKIGIQREPARPRDTQGQSLATQLAFGSSKPQFPLQNGRNHRHLSGKDAVPVAKNIVFSTALKFNTLIITSDFSLTLIKSVSL